MDMSIEKTKTRICTDNGGYLKIRGMLNRQIIMNNNCKNIEFIVCDDLKRDCILELKFFKESRSKFCFDVDASDKTSEEIKIKKHSIKNSSESPIAFPMRRYSLVKEKIIQETVEKWLKEGIIRESYSSWRSPPVLCKENRWIKNVQ